MKTRQTRNPTRPTRHSTALALEGLEDRALCGKITMTDIVVSGVVQVSGTAVDSAGAGGFVSIVRAAASGQQDYLTAVHEANPEPAGCICKASPGLMG